MDSEKDYIPKWHRELGLFSQIKPRLILDGNVLDVYQYPSDGMIPRGAIVRLTDYLFYFFKDAGYSDIVFYDNIQGFYNLCEASMVQRFSALMGAKDYEGRIQTSFRGDKEGGAVPMIRRALGQQKESVTSS